MKFERVGPVMRVWFGHTPFPGGGVYEHRRFVAKNGQPSLSSGRIHVREPDDTEYQGPKYGLSSDPTLARQIQALVDIPSIGVKAGDLGGWISECSVLEQEGDCWIWSQALSFDRSRILGDSQLNSGFIQHAALGGSVDVRLSAVLGRVIWGPVDVFNATVRPRADKVAIWNNTDTRLTHTEVEKLGRRATLSDPLRHWPDFLWGSRAPNFEDPEDPLRTGRGWVPWIPLAGPL